MEINCSPLETQLFKKIGAAADKLGVPAYLIGGFVRDKIIGRPTTDVDVVCIGDGIELAHEVAALFSPKPTVAFFKTFGTAQIKIDDFIIEFVGARKESYASDSRKPSVSPGSIEDDQNRRDFTINALAIGLHEGAFGKLVDPFGGLQAIQDKIIKTPLAPHQTFSDDPLRMLRGIRFACQLGYTIVPETLDAIADSAHRISIISQERITEELNKIYNSCDIYLTTTLGEGWGLTITEAFSTKTPVIAPNTTSITEISGGGTWAYLLNTIVPCCFNTDNIIREQTDSFEVGETIKKVAKSIIEKDPTHISRVEKAYEWTKTIEWKLICKRWVEYFKSTY